MDPVEFFTATGLLIVAGKGGVGKTVATAALARAASEAGLSVLIIEIERKSALAELFGQRSMAYDEIEFQVGEPGRGRILGRTLDPESALTEYLEDHGLTALAKRMSSTGLLEIVANAAPGLKDILVLGKVKQLVRAAETEVILLDAPASGHAITFLRSGQGLLDSVDVGAINTQAREVVELLTDPERCRVLLTTLAEETPVNELIETAYALEDEVGIKLGPIIVNAVYPAVTLDIDAADQCEDIDLAHHLRAAARFRQSRSELQTSQLARLDAELPLAQLRLPFVFSDRIGQTELVELAGAIREAIEKLR